MSFKTLDTTLNGSRNFVANRLNRSNSSPNFKLGKEGKAASFAWNRSFLFSPFLILCTGFSLCTGFPEERGVLLEKMFLVSFASVKNLWERGLGRLRGWFLFLRFDGSVWKWAV